MDLKKCISLIDEHIANVNANMNNLEVLRGINVRFKQLIRSLFSDSNERIKDYEESLKSARNRSSNVIEQSKVMLRFLLAVKDELNLRSTSEEKEGKLFDIKREAEEKGAEAKRREAVTETKFYGATIELIDRLRLELKDRSKTAEDIIYLKNEIKGMKEILNSIYEIVSPK